MNHLLYKEFKLSVHLTSYLFLLLSLMLLIPNYPYYVVFFCQTPGIFFTFLAGNATNDVYFITLLPVRKRDVAKARLLTVVSFELLQIGVSVPFAILRHTLIPAENAAGIEANAAFLGLVMTIFVVAAEAAVQLAPALKMALDTTNPAHPPQQLLVLLAGSLLYALLAVFTYRQSTARFEKLGL
jgi:hypothetical protein